MDKIILASEDLKRNIEKSAQTISDRQVKRLADEWLSTNYLSIFNFSSDKKVLLALSYLKESSANSRLVRKYWLSSLTTIIKFLKGSRYTATVAQKKEQKKLKAYSILPKNLLQKIKKDDQKIYTLGIELNENWQSGMCWNACGILMRIILERALDKKEAAIKSKNGLKNKINFCLSSNIFGQSVAEALKKLDHSTKITGDIVAHDSNILIHKNDIELSITPLNILLKSIF